MTTDELTTVEDRLRRIDPASLSDEQAIQLAQAQAAILSSRAQDAQYQFFVGILAPKLNEIRYTLECDYRRRYGKFPSDETW